MQHAAVRPSHPMASLRLWLGILKESAVRWVYDDAMTEGAAIAFYTIFALGPVMLIVLAVMGTMFGEQAVSGAVHGQLASLLGTHGADAVQNVIRSAAIPQSGFIAKVAGPIVFFISATGVFTEIQSALNKIFGVNEKKALVLDLVRVRLVSFALILASGFVLVVSLVVNASVIAFGEYLFGSKGWAWVTWLTQFPVSLGVTSFISALIFKTLPDAKIHWSDVLVGALLAGLLFSIGKFLIGFYLAQTTIISGYGAAGTFILLLLWVYYSTLIFLYGAEVARIRRDRRRHRTHARMA